MTTDTKTNTDWTLVCHLDYGNRGKACTVNQKDGKISVTSIETSAASGLELNQRPVFLGADLRSRVLLMDPGSHEITRSDTMPADARFSYAYRDPGSVRVWFVNDGDKDGNDTYYCGGQGSSVSIVAKTNGNAEHVESLCIGRGHHMTTFSAPTKGMGHIPHRAFSSNLMDGTISVIGNDPNDAVSFLKTIATINLCDPRKETSSDTNIPNNAFPHGIEYSPVTGKIYNLNNGYGTVAIIDPLSHEVEDLVTMNVSSNLLLSRCGLFLIGKGADRKSNPEHVIGCLSVMDIKKRETVVTLDIQDFYPSVYRFNPKGDKLYVTAAATGKGEQSDNLKTDILQIYDTSALPELKLLKEVKLEPTTAGRRPIALLQQGDRAPYVFVPNPTQGTLAILDGDSDEIVATVKVGDGDMKEFSFSFWHDRAIYGA